MIVLLFKSGVSAGLRFEFAKQEVLLGRSDACDLVVKDDFASSRHCRITVRGRGFLLEDLGSSNGTRFGSPSADPIRSPVEMQVGGSFYIGETLIEILPPQHQVESGDTDSLPATSSELVGEATIMTGRTVSRRSEMAGGSSPMMPAALDGAATEPVDISGRDWALVEPEVLIGDPDEVLAEYEGRARLVFITGPHQSRRVILGLGRIRFGRGPGNEVPLLEPQAAVYHGAVTFEGGAYFLDLVGLGKTFRNGAPVTRRTKLNHKDVIAVGASEFEFQAAGLDPSDPATIAMMVDARPKFVFPGQVKVQEVLTIGRSPDADLFLDDRRVERRQAELRYRNGDFFVHDTGKEGVHVNGRRVSEEKLRNGDAVKLSGFELRLDIEMNRCAIEVVPPPPDQEIPVYAQDVEVASPFMTMYRLPRDNDLAKQGQGQAQKAAPRVKDRGSVLWVPPDDVKRTGVVPMVVVSAAVVTLAAAVVAVASTDESSLLRRPISTAHGSTEFQQLVTAKVGAGNGCAACHVAFSGRLNGRCTECHEKGHDLRPQHARVAALTSRTCTSCHSEHMGLRTALVDGGRCKACHQDRHARFAPIDPGAKVTSPPVPDGQAFDLKADLADSKKASIDAIHGRHHEVPGRCSACHATQAGAERPKGTAYQACLGCHAAEAIASDRCADCHREHSTSWAVPPRSLAEEESALPTASAATMLLLIIPTGLVFAGMSRARRRREEQAAKAEEAPKQSDGSGDRKVTRCDGTDRPVAGKLPRLAANRCTGSGACADACPYDVLRMVDSKPVVAHPELCHECGTCVQVCKPMALSMAAPGDPIPMITVPSLGPNYETTIGGNKGVYVIGEAAGMPLIKNGINLGQWVVEHMLHEGLKAGAAAAQGFDHEVLIVGSGPGGLSAAISAYKHGLKAVLLEKRQELASTIHNFPKKKHVMPSPGHVQSVGPLPIWETTREELLERWKKDLAQYPLDVRLGQDVTTIKAEGPGFVLKTKTGTFRGLRVVIAPGARGDPTKLKKPGDDLPKVLYLLEDPDQYNGKDCMVVGGGDSALEAAIALAEVHGGSNRVSIVYRQEKFAKAKPGNLTKIEQLISAGKITAYMACNPAEVTERSVIVELKDKTKKEVPNDVIICMLGAQAPTKWLEELGIEMVQKSQEWAPGRSDQPIFKMFREDRR